MSNTRDFNWYEILPYQLEYKDEFELVNNRYYFNFVITKNEATTRIFMNARDISSSSYQVRSAKSESIKIYEKNYEFYLTSVFPIATEVIRDKLYEVFSKPEVTNTTFIVSARKISYYEPLNVKNRRLTKKGVSAKTEGKKKTLLNKNAETLYQCKVVVSTNDEQNKIRIHECLPQDHSNFYVRRIKPEKVKMILERRHFYTSPIGYIFNILGWNMVRDTVLSKTGLANLVQLPLVASRYALSPGQSQTISQGFIEETD